MSALRDPPRPRTLQCESEKGQVRSQAPQQHLDQYVTFIFNFYFTFFFINHDLFLRVFAPRDQSGLNAPSAPCSSPIATPFPSICASILVWNLISAWPVSANSRSSHSCNSIHVSTLGSDLTSARFVRGDSLSSHTFSSTYDFTWGSSRSSAIIPLARKPSFKVRV